jgi:hypothetical protein
MMIFSRWPLDTKNDGIVPHEIELMVLWLVWNWINAIVTHSKLNWRWNWIDGIVAYMKLNWRYCDSFEIELTVKLNWRYCGLYEIELTILWPIWNWINGIVALKKLIRRYCGVYEILERVFGMVKSCKDRSSVSLVCKEWYNAERWSR